MALGSDITFSKARDRCGRFAVILPRWVVSRLIANSYGQRVLRLPLSAEQPTTQAHLRRVSRSTGLHTITGPDHMLVACPCKSATIMRRNIC